MQRPDIQVSMAALVADCLAVDVSQVKPESKLIDDLGADSLDFVDILFKIEKTFGVRVRNQELNFIAGLDFSKPEVMKDGALAPEVAARLEEWIPGIQSVEPSLLSPRTVFGMISVETLVRVVEKKLGGSAPA